MTPQAPLFATPIRLDRGVLTTPVIDAALAEHAAVAVGVSGGKDSCLLAFETVRYLDSIGHKGPRILVHADLGRVEWKDSLPTCQRLADRLGLELVVVRRLSGDMMDRWLSRWAANVERYQELLCVKLISPWSSSVMRFCTSELKVAPICRELGRRFRGQTVLNAVGIRRQESDGRKLAPISKPQPAIQGRGTIGYNWNPILDWTKDEVFAALAAHDFPVHEGYLKYGMDRISCAYCVLGSIADLRASATCPDNADVLREMVDLEIVSGFSFQSNRWLGDVAPHLLTEEQRDGLADSKRMAKVREAAESQIPDHLLYTKGWPTCVPSRDEAELLCEVRLKVAAAVGLEGVHYLDPDRLIGRYEELMREAAAKRPTPLDLHGDSP